MFQIMLEHKTKEFGGRVVYVDPKNASRGCSHCSTVSVKNRMSQSKFRCVRCRHSENADTNASKVILARGRWVLALKAA